MSLFDTLVGGLARLIGLPPERDELESPRLGPKPIPLPASTSEPACEEPEPEPEPEPEQPGASSAAPDQLEPAPMVEPRVAQLIAATMREIPKAVGAGLVNLETGALSSRQTALPESILALLGPMTRTLFGDERLVAYERLVEPGEHEQPVGVEQIIINTATTLHVFTRLEQRPLEVLVVVCHAQTNLGLVLAKLKHLVRST